MNRRCAFWRLAIAAIALLCGGYASAQDAAVKVEKIEVTGSNIKRVDGETGLPVTTISRGEIERSGVTTAAELIDRVSAASAGGHSIAQSLGDSNRPGLRKAIALAIHLRVPTMFIDDDYVKMGGLMSFFAFHSDGARRRLAIVDRVFHGQNPAEIPFELPTNTSFTINRATAAAIGLEIPAELLLRATEVFG